MDRGQHAAEAFAGRTGPAGHRRRRRSGVDAGPPTASARRSSGARLLGLVALQDPPRTDVGEAIAACRRGRDPHRDDHRRPPGHRRAIADAVGLRSREGAPVDGADLPADDAVLGDAARPRRRRRSPASRRRTSCASLGRCGPRARRRDDRRRGERRARAARGRHRRGDGASGTDVAREAADLVLLDDHFASIVAGIEQGRSTFINIRRFLTYHLTDNVAELAPFVVWALSGGHVAAGARRAADPGHRSRDRHPHCDRGARGRTAQRAPARSARPSAAGCSTGRSLVARSACSARRSR
jgi:hypothetical protein